MSSEVRASLKRAAGRVLKGALRPGVGRHSVAFFLASLVVMMVSSPFIERFSWGTRLESVLMFFVLVSALLAVGGRRNLLIAATALAVPAMLLQWTRHARPELVSEELQIASGGLFVLFVTACLLRFILLARRTDSEVLCAGVAVYLMIGLLWAIVYRLVEAAAPGSFAFSTGPESERHMHGYVALYFSFTTLTTVGYGDVSPVSGAARMLAMAEAVTGVFYLALMISRLVSLHASGAELGAPGKAG